jgi:hypothetical protein|tara:strand:- start:78 stop:263 length:186 start_codon:yes stop_codon:yes gene_type:complete
MSKNLWEKERNVLFRSLVRQYSDEGYTSREANKLAKEELQEIMADRENFVDDIWKQVFEDE